MARSRGRREPTSKEDFMPDVTPTLVDESNQTYLVLRVAVAHDHSEVAEAAQTRWCAEVADASSPLAGLYAFGDSLATVRDTVATLAWAAIAAGELRAYGIEEHSVAGIHVVVTTCAVYEASWLTIAIANDAA
jgi:hypothetical protein